MNPTKPDDHIQDDDKNKDDPDPNEKRRKKMNRVLHRIIRETKILIKNIYALL